MTDPIAFAMADAARLFRRNFDARIKQLGVTGPQWRVLVIVVRNPGITQRAAAELLEVEPITLSRKVDLLEQAGLIERRAVSGDRRARALFLTNHAAPLVEAMRAEALALHDEALDGFSESEQVAFSDYVERFRANLSRQSAVI
ncbi:MAG: MarR family transcriptional regulator [Pseudomonadota bacterium]